MHFPEPSQVSAPPQDYGVLPPYNAVNSTPPLPTRTDQPVPSEAWLIQVNRIREIRENNQLERDRQANAQLFLELERYRTRGPPSNDPEVQNDPRARRYTTQMIINRVIRDTALRAVRRRILAEQRNSRGAPSLEERDDGRPAPKEVAEMTVKLDCKICMSQVVDTVIMPCGHAVLCRWCADLLIPSSLGDATRCAESVRCPICRAGVSRKVRQILFYLTALPLLVLTAYISCLASDFSRIIFPE